MSTQQEELRKLHESIGWNRLYPWWAKIEIMLGLAAVSVGVVATARGIAPENIYWSLIVSGCALITSGGYLAMAGHRSHLYQSNNQLTAYLIARVQSMNKGHD